ASSHHHTLRATPSHPSFPTRRSSDLATVSKHYGHVVFVLPKYFIGANFIDDQHFATLTLQLGTTVLQWRGISVSSFCSKTDDVSVYVLASVALLYHSVRDVFCLLQDDCWRR